MSAQNQRDEEHQSHDQLESPGKRLRIARQSKGLSQQDIAAQLHLSSSIVQALEHDDHDRLPGPVFVRGYLRNYARLLDLEDNAVLTSFDDNPGDTGGTPLSVTSGVKPEIRSSHFGIRLITWIIVLALIGLLAAWWQGRLEWPTSGSLYESAPPAAPVVDEQGGLLLPEPELEPVKENADEMEVPADFEDSSRSYTPPAEPEDAPEPVEPAPEAPMNAVETMQAEVPQQRDLAESAPAPAPEATPGAPAEPSDSRRQPADGEAAPAIDAVAGNSVVFEFIGSCWVDIRDSTRTFKLFGEMKQGERHELGGTPPYSVILGNSPMVRVSVGGEPYDVEPHSRGNVARFTLDPQAGQ